MKTKAFKTAWLKEASIYSLILLILGLCFEFYFEPDYTSPAIILTAFASTAVFPLIYKGEQNVFEVFIKTLWIRMVLTLSLFTVLILFTNPSNFKVLAFLFCYLILTFVELKHILRLTKD